MSLRQRFGGRVLAIMLTFTILTGLGVLMNNFWTPHSVYADNALSPEQTALREQLLAQNTRNYAIATDSRPEQPPMIWRRSDGRLVTGSETGLSITGTPRLTSNQEQAIHSLRLVTHPVDGTQQQLREVRRDIFFYGGMGTFFGVALVIAFGTSTHRGGPMNFENLAECIITASVLTGIGAVIAIAGVLGGSPRAILGGAMFGVSSASCLLIAHLWCYGATERKRLKELRAADQTRECDGGMVV